MLLFMIVAGITAAPLCFGFENIIADTVLEKLELSIGKLDGEQFSSVLEALYLQNECSNEVWECEKPGALADATTVRCFSICVTVETGCRSCCSEGTCYRPPVTNKDLGSCLPCSEDPGDEQCAPPL
jgi:hypothetical protein